MTRTCEGCDNPFEAARPTARWCSERCRGRARRSGRAASSRADRSTSPRAPGSVARATITQLEALGSLETWRGQAAVALALRIDSDSDTGSSTAALVRELIATMGAIDAGLPAEQDSIDELRLRRLRRLRGEE